MDTKDCKKCQETELCQSLEIYLVELDEVITKIKREYINKLGSIIELEQGACAVHREYEEIVNKFCNTKCGTDYPLLKECSIPEIPDIPEIPE